MGSVPKNFQNTEKINSELRYGSYIPTLQMGSQCQEWFKVGLNYANAFCALFNRDHRPWSCLFIKVPLWTLHSISYKKNHNALLTMESTLLWSSNTSVRTRPALCNAPLISIKISTCIVAEIGTGGQMTFKTKTKSIIVE